MNITGIGAVRLHFNRHGAAPLVWCVATDDFEIAVKGFLVRPGVAIQSVYSPKSTPDDEDGKASAWLETEDAVRVTIVDGWAYLEPIEEAR